SSTPCSLIEPSSDSTLLSKSVWYLFLRAHSHSSSDEGGTEPASTLVAAWRVRTFRPSESDRPRLSLYVLRGPTSLVFFSHSRNLAKVIGTAFCCDIAAFRAKRSSRGCLQE